MNIFLITAISFLILRLGIFFFLHTKYRELSVFKNTVSDYGTGSSRQLYRLMSSLSIVAYAALLLYLSTVNLHPMWPVYILGVAVVGSIAILFFPTDRTGEKVTRTGRIHWALAVLNFATLFIFMTNVQIPAVSSQSDIFVVVTWIVRITFYAFLASLILPKLRRSALGFTERLFLTATPAWFIVFSFLLLK